MKKKSAVVVTESKPRKSHGVKKQQLTDGKHSEPVDDHRFPRYWLRSPR